jgi:hypothetical protein
VIAEVRTVFPTPAPVPAINKVLIIRFIPLQGVPLLTIA